MTLYNEIFPLVNSWLLISSIITATAAIWLHYKQQYRWSVGLLFIAAFLIRLFVAHLDPFLHDWDERYHALVARNMLHHPFKPMLYAQPIVPYDFIYWTNNHIWLHKQPLFLWQMALSMKMFGVSEFAIRYPSVLLGSLGVVLIYRIAYLLTLKRTTALLAGLLACFSYYHLEVVAVFRGMDGNDISFEFYVLASIWAYAEYIQQRKIKWVILIGIFAGCAVLNKWLTGLIIYAPWAFNILWNIRTADNRKQLFHFFISLLVCAVVFLPWQLYIFHAFPTEALYEYNYNTKHVREVVEGHGGDNLYYYHYLPNYFGDVLWYLLPIGMVYIFFKKDSNKQLSVTLTANVLLVFVFFSFIAKTKMDTYFMAAIPAGYIFIAIVVDSIILIKQVRRYLFLPAVLVCTLLIFKIPTITQHHSPESADKLNRWKTKAQHTAIYKQLQRLVPTDTKVILNCDSNEDIDVMFYYNNATAYSWCMNDSSFAKYVVQRGLHIAVFKGFREHGVPEYVSRYPNTHIIDVDLQ